MNVTIKQTISYHNNEWGEPAARYRWTSWVWEAIDWSSRLQDITNRFRESREHIPMCPKITKNNQKMLKHNWRGLGTLVSQPIMPTNLTRQWPQTWLYLDVQKCHQRWWVSLQNSCWNKSALKVVQRLVFTRASSLGLIPDLKLNQLKTWVCGYFGWFYIGISPKYPKLV